ncbi:hypothetical protein C2S52_010061 [Perilla frutescens var. hirtella]|nr:hypothetical protein C2S52_010061 [Perilla frutescens var. hirtella]
MCPPVQSPREIGLYWSDEQIISLLADYLPGSPLPENVIDDSSPFLNPPSNLPEGTVWYLVRSNEKKESVHGFWKAKGEACKVYSNTVINGWRTTLEYFEGLAPDGKITDWLMQEYMITPKELSDVYKPKEFRLLCSIFQCKDYSSRSEMNPQKCKTIIESKNINPVVSVNPETKINSDQDAGNKSEAKRESEVGAFPVVADPKPNSPLEEFSEAECFSRGDFLELDDLRDPESHSSSSQNSSCPSKLSEEYFGSSAFLRDIDEAVNSYKEEQLSSSGYRFSTSVVQNDVILQPPLSGTSVLCGPDVRADAIETSRTSSDTDKSLLTDKRVQGNSTKRHNPESKTEGTSNPQSAGAPSTSRNNAASPSEERKSGGSGRMKKFRTYFCFAAF